MSDRWWEDERLSRYAPGTKKPPRYSERKNARLLAEKRRAAKRAASKEPGLSADAADRRAAARARNAARGARETGGPGQREIREAQSVKTVVELQRKLVKAGFNVAVDGIMGPQTARAYAQWRNRLGEAVGAQIEREIAKDPTQGDQKRLAQRFGAPTAKMIQQQRLARNRGVADYLNAMGQRAVAGPEPGPGLGDRLRDFLGSLQGGTSGTGRGSRLATTAGAVGGITKEPFDMLGRVPAVWGTSAYYALADPTKLAGDVEDIVYGTGRMIGALAAMPRDPGLALELGRALINDYRERYGENWQQYAREDPLYGLLDALGAANVAGRVGGIAGRTADLAPESGFAKALGKAWSESYRPTTPRVLTDKYGAEAMLPQRTSPVGRKVARGYDIVSENLPAGLPGSAQKRVARQQIREARMRQMRRATERGELVGLVGSPGKIPVLRHFDQETRQALFAEAQLPKGMRNPEGMHALADALQEAYNQPLPKPELPLTERTLITQRQVAHLEGLFDKLLEERRKQIATEARVGPLTAKARQLRGARITATKEPTVRPRTAEELASRLDALDKRFDDLLDNYVVQVMFSGDKKAAAKFNVEAQRLKNMQYAPGKRAARRAEIQVEISGLGKERSIIDTMRNQAEEALTEWVEKNPDSPAAKQILDLVEERRELRDTFNTAAVPEPGAVPDYGTVTEPAGVDVIDAELEQLADEIRARKATIGEELTGEEIVEYAGRYDASLRKVGGALSMARDDLERAMVRHERRLERTTVEGLEAQLKRAQQRRNKLKRGTEKYEQAERLVERAAVRLETKKQVEALAGEARRVLTAKRTREMAEAITYGRGKRYQAALEAADQLTLMIEDAKLRLAYHPEDYPDMLAYETAVAKQIEVFNNRRRIFAQLMEMEGTPGSYMPHLAKVSGGRSGMGGFRGDTMFKNVDLSSLTLKKRNELKRILTGRAAFDSRALAMEAQKVGALEFADDIRGIIFNHPSRRPILAGHMPDPDVVVVKARGKITPKEWEAYLENADELVPALEKYIDSMIRPANDLGDWADPKTGLVVQEGLWQVPASVVDDYFHFLGGKSARRFGGGVASKTVEGIDVVQNMTKMAIMYSNPGYYVANALGNVAFLGIAYDPYSAWRSLRRARKVHKSDPDTWRLMGVEMGEGPAQSLMAETLGTGLTGKVLAVQRSIAHAAGFADRGPRIAAFIHEAAKEGFKTPEGLRKLMHSDSLGAVATRARISERARRAMADFDAMTPFERNAMRRLIFVYPWLRASAKWSKDLLMDRPERAALIGHAASATNEEWQERWEEILGRVPDLPSWLEIAWPVSAEDGKASVINAASINPFSTLAEMIRYGEGLAHPNEPTPKYSAIWEAFNPAIQSAAQAFRAENQFGVNVGYTEAIKAFLEDVVPGYSMGKQLGGDVSGVYDDPSAKSTFARRSLRVYPYGIDLAEAQNRAVSEGTALSTPGDRAVQRLRETQKQAAAHFKSSGGKPPVRAETINLAYDRKAEIERMRADLAATLEGGDENPNWTRLRLEQEVKLAKKFGFIRERRTLVNLIKRIRTADEATLRTLTAIVSSGWEPVYGPIRDYERAAGVRK